MNDFEIEIKEISTLRETKGREEETLNKINELIPQVEKTQEHKLLAKLHWEAHLVWQHKVMNELAKPVPEQNQQSIQTAKDKMTEYAVKAKDIIENNQLIDMKGGAYRFLGRAATYNKDHGLARQYYETALNNFEGKNLKSILEVSGLLAESIIRMGNPDDGLALAKKTYDDFYHSEMGQNLKNEDYFTWAIWLSGIPPRTITALIETNANFDKEDMKNWIKGTLSELQNPSGEITWGDDKFSFRIAEIETVIKRLEA